MRDWKPHLSNWLHWAFPTVDRATRKIGRRSLYASLRDIPEPDRAAIIDIMRQRDHSAIVKYRQHFTEGDITSVRQAVEESAFDGVYGFTIPGYHEDQEGKPLGELAFMQAVAGSRDIIVIGNPASVMQDGPTDMVRRELWTVERANLIARFLELIEVVFGSEWIRSGPSAQYTFNPDGSIKLLSFDHPPVYMVASVLLFLRQLISQDDKVFRLATDYYLCHCGDERKRWYVKERRDAFKDQMQSVDGSFGLKISHAELIDLFLYGLGMVHQDKPEKATAFADIVRQHGRVAVMQSIHMALLSVASHKISATGYRAAKGRRRTV
jgi:hypothetical protein